MRPDGLPLWTSEAEPGHPHDITAARLHVLPALYRAASLGMPTLADCGYEGAGIGIHVPVKNPGGSQELDTGTRTTLQHTTASPRGITQIVRAALVLTQFEHKYLN
jgi:hypothetical protein